MYDELVNVLRGCVLSKPCEACPYYDKSRPSEKCMTLNADAADAIDALDKPQWIPVTERLPQDGERALVMRYDSVTSVQFYDLLWFENGEWWNRHFAGDYAVTHWMQLPEPPKEE